MTTVERWTSPGDEIVTGSETATDRRRVIFYPSALPSSSRYAGAVLASERGPASMARRESRRYEVGPSHSRVTTVFFQQPVVMATRESWFPTPRWLRYVQRRFSELGWRFDAEGGMRPDLDVLNRAWNVALQVFEGDTLTPSVVPSEAGGVEFVWHKGGWDVELEVDAEGSSVWVHNRITGETSFGPLSELQPRLFALLRQLSED